MKILQGIKVLDFSRVLAGPYATMILADYGAEVTKVEIPGTGDDSRAFGPFLNGHSLYFANVNRGKKSMTLNLKSPAAREIVEKLVQQADVVVENFRPETMEKLGLGYNDLKKINEKIIYGCCSGFGHTGVWSKKPAYDPVIQAISGFMSVTGPEHGEPTKAGPSIMDVLSGILLAKGILAALYARDRFGIGQKVDVSMLDGGLSILENAMLIYLTSGQSPSPIGNRHPSATPVDAFQGSDGRHFMISIGNDHLWAAFCIVLKHEELIADGRFATNELRTANQKQLKTILTGQFAIRPTAEWLELLDQAGIPCAPVNNMADVYQLQELKERNMFVEVENEEYGKHTLIGPAVKFSETPAAIQGAAPPLGRHTTEVLKEQLGYTDEQIAQLAADKVI